jgi:hypothetical protein
MVDHVRIFGKGAPDQAYKCVVESMSREQLIDANLKLQAAWLAERAQVREMERCAVQPKPLGFLEALKAALKAAHG